MASRMRQINDVILATKYEDRVYHVVVRLTKPVLIVVDTHSLGHLHEYFLVPHKRIMRFGVPRSLSPSPERK